MTQIVIPYDLLLSESSFELEFKVYADGPKEGQKIIQLDKIGYENLSPFHAEPSLNQCLISAMHDTKPDGDNWVVAPFEFGRNGDTLRVRGRYEKENWELALKADIGAVLNNVKLRKEFEEYITGRQIQLEGLTDKGLIQALHGKTLNNFKEFGGIHCHRSGFSLVMECEGKNVVFDMSVDEYECVIQRPGLSVTSPEALRPENKRLLKISDMKNPYRVYEIECEVSRKHSDPTLTVGEALKALDHAKRYFREYLQQSLGAEPQLAINLRSKGEAFHQGLAHAVTRNPALPRGDGNAAKRRAREIYRGYVDHIERGNWDRPQAVKPMACIYC